MSSSQALIPRVVGALSCAILIAAPADRTSAQRTASGWSAPPIWRGAYLGLHGSYDLADVLFTEPSVSAFDASALGFGIHGGYNWQLGGLVAGLELDASQAPLKLDGTSGGSTYDVRHNVTTSARARLGVAFDDVLVYGTVGVAALHYDTVVQTGSSRLQASDFATGIVWGGGVEMALLPSLSLKVEALHFDYGRVDGGGFTASPEQTTVRAGLTLRFN